MSTDQSAGMIRFMRALGVVGALVASLLTARVWAPVLSVKIGTKLPLQQIGGQIVWQNTPHLDQFLTYTLSLSLAGLFLAIWLALDGFIARSSLASLGVRVTVFVGAIAFALLTSGSLGLFVLAGALGATPILASYAGGGRARARTPAETTLAMIVVLCGLVSVAWGSWLVFASRGCGVVSALLAILLAGFSTAYAICATARGDGGRALRRSAIAASPLFALPLLGFVRGPSPGWLGLLVLSAVAIHELFRRTDRDPRLPGVLASVFAPLAVASIFVIPLDFRDMERINHLNHEAQHLAWLNSALFGKFLGADAGFTYGPLREYLLLLWLRLSSVSAEQLRVAHVLLTLFGLALLLHVGWFVSGRKPLLQAWLAYMLIVYTPLSCFMRYHLYVSFGYADLLRTALPLTAIVLFVRAVTGVASEPSRALRDFRSVWLAAVLSGASLLYSQEFGICCIAACLLAVLADGISKLSVSGVRNSAVRSLQIGVAYGLGTAVAPVLLTLIYGLFGKAGALWRRLLRVTTLAASGSFGSIEVPISSAALLHPWSLMRDWWRGNADDPRFHDAAAGYLVPPGVYLLTGAAILLMIARRRFSARSLLLLALLAFGAVSYRMTLARADKYHLLTTAAPAVLLLAALGADAVDYRVGRAHARFRIPVGAIAVLCFALVSAFTGECMGGLSGRVNELLAGVETAPTRQRYENGVARAGDVMLQPAWARSVLEIQRRTSEKQAIFVRSSMMGGSELYFLAARRNPTSYDLLAEIVTKSDQEQLLAELERDPPELVIGTDEEYVGPRVAAYLREKFPVHFHVGAISFATRR